MLTLVGLLTLALVWRLLPETGRPSGQLDLRQLLKDYRALLLSARFVGYAAGGGLATLSIHAFFATAPFLFVQELNEPVGRVGLYMGLMISGMAIGNLVAVPLAGRIPGARLLRLGGLLSLGSSITVLCAYFVGHIHAAFVIPAMMVFTCGTGIVNPVALASAMRVEDRLIGVATGLAGSIQTAIGAFCTALAAASTSPTAAALGILAGATVLSQVAFLAARRGRQ